MANITKYMPTGKLPIFLAAFLISLLFGLGAGASEAEAYRGARLIDNVVFRNSTTMSKNKIQSFLQNKNSGLKSRSFKLDCYGPSSKERQLYTSVGAPCDQVIPASHIIYYASRIYDINPQVVLATLQKEQSLITTANPTSWQIKNAMGYNCPTTGSCGSPGFYRQIDHGVWALRFHYERASGNLNWWVSHSSWVCGTAKNFYKPHLYPGTHVRFYDGNGVHYRTHKLANAATSALYCYTPHAYNNPQGQFGLPKYGTKGQYYTGSYNFVRSFNQWFGSVFGTPFFRIGNNDKIYIMGSENNFYHVSSWATLRAYGWGRSVDRVQKVGSNHVSGKTMSGKLPKIARFEADEIYLMDRGGRNHFASVNMMERYGFEMGDEAQLPALITPYFKLSGKIYTIAKNSHGHDLYLIDDAKKRHFAGPSAYHSGDPAFSSLPVSFLTKEFLKALPSEAPIIAPGATFRIGSTDAVYLVSDFDKRVVVPSPSLMSEFGLAFNKVKKVKSAHASTYQLDANSLNNFVRDDLGDIKLVHSGTTIRNVSSEMASSTNFDIDELSLPVLSDAALDKYQSSDPLTELIRAHGEFTVYKVENATKRPISSPAALFSLGFTFDDVTDVSGHFVNRFPSGSPITE